MKPYDVEVADVFDWLDRYEGPRFHAVLCDPPYALISIAKRFGPGQEEAQEGTDGRFRRLSIGFMGQEWDGFDSLESYQQWVADWSRLLIEKALYPGAVCLFFGGTRTWHRLACGLEDGGFEIYDTFLWLYGQGFPKSHDISKFIDKQAGAERTEVEGPKPGPGHKQFLGRDTDGDTRFRGTYHGFDRPWMDDPEARERYHMKMKPATDEAERWDGWGTALKPAWEPIIICRAPRGDHGYADLALKFGTGALNIHDSRISYQDTGDKDAAKPQGKATAKTGGLAGGIESDAERSEFRPSANAGRWPSNFGLEHAEDCVPVGIVDSGEQRVINRFKDGAKPFGGGAGHEYETIELGPDQALLWACVPGCSVRDLDEQAGFQRSGGWPERRKSDMTRMVYGKYDGHVPEPQAGPSTGQVSRFYYCSKAAKSERDLGLEDFYWARDREQGWVRISHPLDMINHPKYKDARIIQGNIHPTVKPLELCRYLATLIRPPALDEPRRLLVPFAGSGSEMIGARQAEWDHVVGVELVEIYAEIAEARLRANIGMF